jgi:hypothetical protein
MIVTDEIKANDVYLGQAKTKPRREKHIPSKVQADTLFTFTPQLDFLINSLRLKMLSPRYCTEDVRYLKIDGIKQIAIPMKCFCDINMHRLGEHLQWYGYYGIAFSKEWGMKKRIQPIQYINRDSYLCKDFSAAFNKALQIDIKNQTKAEESIKNFLLLQLMYLKPYSGRIKNRNTNKESLKCFTDECEWRFVPDVTKVGYDQVYIDDEISNAGNLYEFSNAMNGVSQISLIFDYKDIKYIIIKSNDEFNTIGKAISEMNLDEMTRNLLLSKIIIWENSRGDF